MLAQTPSDGRRQSPSHGKAVTAPFTQRGLRSKPDAEHIWFSTSSVTTCGRNIFPLDGPPFDGEEETFQAFPFEGKGDRRTAVDEVEKRWIYCALVVTCSIKNTNNHRIANCLWFSDTSSASLRSGHNKKRRKFSAAFSMMDRPNVLSAFYNQHTLRFRQSSMLAIGRMAYSAFSSRCSILPIYIR